jgi:hypothetical protein
MIAIDDPRAHITRLVRESDPSVPGVVPGKMCSIFFGVLVLTLIARQRRIDFGLHLGFEMYSCLTAFCTWDVCMRVGSRNTKDRFLALKLVWAYTCMVRTLHVRTLKKRGDRSTTMKRRRHSTASKKEA